MKIITTQCPNCGTIVAGNVIEENRVMKCPRLECDNVLRFEDLSEVDRVHISENRQHYEI